MQTPTFSNSLVWFYPTGNTPAICLTQSLPPEEEANVLLLGCGDVRNILFTSYCDDRPLDVTCCDLERAVIARDILLLSLIIDDVDGQRSDDNWNIFYHLYITQDSLDRVQRQAQKLRDLAASLSSWNGSQYGRSFSFCDNDTLEKVCQVWAFWFSTETSQPTTFESSFSSSLSRARKRKQATLDSAMFLGGMRSAAPAGLDVMEDWDSLHKRFWKHGTTEHIPRATNPNPMFACPDGPLILHYGVDPLQGFHVSAAAIPMVARPESHPGATKPHKIVASARSEFRAWSNALRQRPTSDLKLRFFVGDALSFCLVLQSRLGTEVPASGWYRTRREMQPIVLDLKAFGPAGTAPRRWNVIDTSNLIDHVGTLNLLVAVSPLLDFSVASTLHTELLAHQGNSLQDLVEDLLYGNLATIALLLDLFPVEYWSNACPYSAADELLFGMAARRIGAGDFEQEQFLLRMSWKRPGLRNGGSVPSTRLSPPLIFDETELVALLHGVFKAMFANEGVASILSSRLDPARHFRKMSLPLYNRPSFVVFLRRVQRRVKVDWNKTMNTLLDRLFNDRIFRTGQHFWQEMSLHMHLLGVHSDEVFQRRYNTGNASRLYGDIRDWKGMPSVVCVTLRVPRADFSFFAEQSSGSLALQCTLMDLSDIFDGWINAFTAVQIGFGSILTSGPRHSDSFRVNIQDDPLGLHGKSPLFAVFQIPAWMLEVDPRTVEVAFGLKNTPKNAAMFSAKLGMFLSVFKTVVADTNNVFISKDLPNSGRMPPSEGLLGQLKSLDISSPSSDIDTAFKVKIGTLGKISALTGRLDIVSSELQTKLKDGCLIQTTALSPMAFKISLGETDLSLNFPLPVDERKFRTLIARTSSYIEVVAPTLVEPALTPSGSLTYPVYLDAGTPVAWNLPYVNPSRMPIIDASQKTKLEPFNTHLSFALSKRERIILDPPLPHVGIFPIMPTTSARARIDLKNSIFSLFMRYTALQSEHRVSVFALASPTDDMPIFIFVRALRLDLSNRTLVLDAAVLPLHVNNAAPLRSILTAITSTNGRDQCSVGRINVDDNEMELWKAVLPAYVERCRTWSHREDCEYVKAGKVPLSVEKGAMSLCTCGNGDLGNDSDGFDSLGVPRWREAAKYAVRAAISPMFPCPLSEELYDGSLSFGEPPGGGGGGGGNPGPGARRPQNQVSESKMHEIKDDECANCGKKSAAGKGLRTCSLCLEVRYCSRGCQRSDWKKHKAWCIKDAKKGK